MTAQMEEILIYDGEEMDMSFCPPIKEHPRIIEHSEEELEERAENEEDFPSFVFSTDCWRGYQGTWEIKDGRFYLVGLAGRLELQGDKSIFADWFTGILRVTRGEMLHYVHMGFGSIFEEELHIKIEKGIVKKTAIIDNRNKEFDEYALTWSNMPGGENRFPGDEDIYPNERRKLHYMKTAIRPARKSQEVLEEIRED